MRDSVQRHTTAGPERPQDAHPYEERLRVVLRQVVARFCEGSEEGLDLGSRFLPGTSPLAVAEAVAQVILAAGEGLSPDRREDAA